MIKEIIRNALLIVVGFASTVQAVEEGAAAAFTRFNLHPQSIAMGSAYSALAKGAEGLALNPAAIAKGQDRELLLSGTQAFETRYIRGDVRLQTKWMPIAFAFLYSDFGSVSNTSVADNNRLAEVGGNSHYLGQSVSVGTAKRLTKRLSVGAAAAFVVEQISGSDASAMALDLGLLAEFGTWSVASVIKNVNEPKMTWNTDSGSTGVIPRIVQLGVSKKWLGRIDQSIEIKMRENRDPTFHAGLAVYPMTNLSLQVGVDDGLLTLGTGLHMSNVETVVSWKKKDFDAFEEAFQLGLKIKTF